MGSSRYASPGGGKKRKAGGRTSGGRSNRNITRWSANKDIALLCALAKECRRDKYRLSWDRIARWIGPNITGAAIEQHISKLYGKYKEWHQLQRPRNKKRKVADEDLEVDYIEDDNVWSKGNEAFANIFYEKPEHTAGMLKYEPESDAESYIDDLDIKHPRRRASDDIVQNDVEDDGFDMDPDQSFGSAQGGEGQDRMVTSYENHHDMFPAGRPASAHGQHFPGRLSGHNVKNQQMGRHGSMPPQGYYQQPSFGHRLMPGTPGGSPPHDGLSFPHPGPGLPQQMMGGHHGTYGYAAHHGQHYTGHQSPRVQMAQYQQLQQMHPSMAPVPMQQPMMRRGGMNPFYGQRHQSGVVVTSADSGPGIETKVEHGATDDAQERDATQAVELPKNDNLDPSTKDQVTTQVSKVERNNEEDGDYYDDDDEPEHE